MNETLSRPTTLGLAFWDAAHKMRNGGNSLLALQVRRTINKDAQRYSVAMPAVNVHRVPAELKGI